MIWYTSCFVLFTFCVIRSTLAAVSVVQTTSGPVRGLWTASHIESIPFVAFRGIPYAEPPVGPLRFKPPVPIRPWTPIRDCYEHGSICLQATANQPADVRGSEDCLTLNVYTPSVKGSRPVLVYIYGGAFYRGSANSDMFGPDFLIEEDVIVVTINYRVGMLGFLSFNNSDISGNQGLKDQQLALRWIRENAQYFGGDPNRVTLAGQSAGSLSVQLHMLAAGSQNLFQQAILMSTAFDSRSVFRATNITNIVRQMQLFLQKHGIEVSDEYELIRELMVIEPEWFVLDFPFDKFLGFPMPIMECDDSPEPFMVGPPEMMAMEGDFNLTIDVLAGYASNEGISLGSHHLFDIFRQEFHVDIPTIHFDLNYTSDSYIAAANYIERNFFPGGFTNESWTQYVRLMSDIFQTYPGDQKVRRMAEQSSGQTYHYVFDLDTRLNYAKRWTQSKEFSNDLEGASHADDICYVFFCGGVFPSMYDGVDKGSLEYAFVRKMSGIFGDFVKTGRTYWKPVKVGEMNYLHMGMDGFEDKLNGFEDGAQFWDGVVSRFL